MTGRWPVTLVAVVGALTAGIAAQAAAAPVGSLAWALAAGLGLTLMLRGVGLRIVGVLLVLLAIGGAVWAFQSGHWVPAAGFVVAGIASLGVIVWGPGWRREREGASARPLDLWQAMDAGDDPTRLADEQDSPPSDQSG